MATITRVTAASVDASTAMFAPQITGLIAGEALDACAPCYVKAADGKVYMSNGTAANAAAKVDGFTPRSAAAGEAITLFGPGTRMRYGSGLTPSADYYLSATAGRLDDAATTGGTAIIARAITATDIVVMAKQ
jgi:hypothetical protein